MGAQLILLFNHELTPDQWADACAALGVSRFIEPPETCRELWRSVPPDLPALTEFLRPVREWLRSVASPGDHVLIQGDFGATYLMVRYASALGLTPVYATTERQAREEVNHDGSVTLTHRFRHRRFRVYGV